MSVDFDHLKTMTCESPIASRVSRSTAPKGNLIVADTRWSWRPVWNAPTSILRCTILVSGRGEGFVPVSI